jgi:hypothetical protein
MAGTVAIAAARKGVEHTLDPKGRHLEHRAAAIFAASGATALGGGANREAESPRLCRGMWRRQSRGGCGRLNRRAGGE